MGSWNTRLLVVAGARGLTRYLVDRARLMLWPGLCRAAWLIWRRRLGLIDPHVDGAFYVRQIHSASERAGASVDPSLHYLLTGWTREFSPNPGFDPVFYRASNPALPWNAEPLSDFARRGGATPANEIAARPSRAGRRDRGTVFTLHHMRGGGSGRYLADYENGLLDAGYAVTRLARVAKSAPLFRPQPIGIAAADGPVFDLLADEAALVGWLREAGPVRLVVNHIIDLPETIFTWLPKVCAEVGIPFDLILHDYFVLCPRINMIDGTGLYCGDPPVERCIPCVRRNGSEAGQVDPVRWRERSHGLLRAAACVIVPSSDLAERIGRHWPDVEIRVREPECDTQIAKPTPPRLQQDEPLRIAVLGALGTAKGYDVVLALAREINRRDLPLRIVLIGESVGDAALRRHGVVVHGRYRDGDAGRCLDDYRPHCVFLASVWPETWSFTLTIALSRGLPVCAFDIGAIAQRLQRHGLGELMPLALAEDAFELAERFVALRSRWID